MSADGSNIFAAVSSAHWNYPVSPGLIYISTNFGTTWDATSAPVTNWQSLACSADGTTVLAGTYGGPIYCSKDSGTTWAVANADISSWPTVACSAGGNVFVAATENGSPYGYCEIVVSTNAGTAWNETYFPQSIRTVASSGDGTQLMAAKYWIYGDRIVISTNFGVTWTNSGAPINGWSSIASSADGRYLISGTEDIPFSIYTSTDAGGSWTTNDVPSERWWCVASSAGGTKLIAGSVPGNPGQYGIIYTSTNSGDSWISNNVPNLFWSSVASSADGCKLVAATFNGQIYTQQITPTPVLSITLSATNVLLSWIVPSTAFVLQESSDITLGVWSEIDVSPTLNFINLNYEVRLPLSPDSKFFRLATK